MAWQQHIMQPHRLQKNAPVGVLNPYLINDPGYLEYQQEKQRLKDKKAEELKKKKAKDAFEVAQKTTERFSKAKYEKETEEDIWREETERRRVARRGGNIMHAGVNIPLATAAVAIVAMGLGAFLSLGKEDRAKVAQLALSRGQKPPFSFKIEETPHLLTGELIESLQSTAQTSQRSQITQTTTSTSGKQQFTAPQIVQDQLETGPLFKNMINVFVNFITECYANSQINLTETISSRTTSIKKMVTFYDSYEHNDRNTRLLNIYKSIVGESVTLNQQSIESILTKLNEFHQKYTEDKDNSFFINMYVAFGSLALLSFSVNESNFDFQSLNQELWKIPIYYVCQDTTKNSTVLDTLKTKLRCSERQPLLGDILSLRKYFLFGSTPTK